MTELAFSGNKLAFISLEEKIAEEEILTGLALRRKNFHFPKEFTFEDKKFRDEVLELYGRHSFDKTNPDWRAEKKKIRQDYHQKIEEYFIVQFDWPKGIAEKLSKIISLPAERKKNKLIRGLRYGFNILESLPLGNFHEKYLNAAAKFMERKPEFITKTNILADIGSWTSGIGTIYGLYFLDKSGGLVGEVYDHLGVGKGIVEKAMYIGFAARTLQIMVRSYAFVKYKKHIPSYATMLSINPFNSFPAIGMFSYDAYSSMKKQTGSKQKMISEESNTKIPLILEKKEIAPSFVYSPTKISGT